MRQILLLLGLIAATAGCKKNVEYPPEIRPSEFWVQYTIEEETGTKQLYRYQGEDSIAWSQIPGYSVTIDYFSNSEIQNNRKQIVSGLTTFFLGTPFSLRLNHPDIVTDPFTPPEWTVDDLENLLYPGQSFSFGDEPGEAKLFINDFPDGVWTCYTSSLSNQSGYCRVLSVEDYGSPELGVQYFGKKVHISFAGTLFQASGTVWTLHDGEAVLFFRYYKF